MDGPNVNLVFEKKLSQYFEDELDSSFLSLGLCSFHPVHTAFRKFATNVSAAYAMKHTETRWRSMKYVCVLVLEQSKNLKEYILNFLPKDKTFKQRIAPTSRHKRIKTTLESALTEPYIAFYAVTTQDF